MADLGLARNRRPFGPCRSSGASKPWAWTPGRPATEDGPALNALG